MSNTPERPIALTVKPENIPAELKALYIWTCWRYEWDERRQKWTKVPYIPFTTSKASSTRESSWRSFQAAYNCLMERRDFFDGIFACLSEKDPYAGGDFDHTDDQSRIPHTYAELSPSGGGYRFIGRGVLQSAVKKPNGELYDRKRFLSITGHILPGFPCEILPIQPALDALYTELKGSANNTKEGKEGSGSRAEKVKRIPEDWWNAGRDIMRTKDRNSLLARLRASALNKTTRKPDTQLALAIKGDFHTFQKKYPYVGIVRADGSIDESQVRAVVAEGIRIRRFTFPEYTALMSHFFAADYLAKHGKNKERWREELAALWFRSRTPRQDDYTPAVVEPVARGRASSHQETLQRAYDILVSFKAGAEALLTVQDLAEALGASRSTANALLAELKEANRITTRQAGQYGGLVVTFSGVQIEEMPIVNPPHTENSNGHSAEPLPTAKELSGVQIEENSMGVLSHPNAINDSAPEAQTTAKCDAPSIDYICSTVFLPGTIRTPEKRIRDRVSLPELAANYLDQPPDQIGERIVSAETGAITYRRTASHFAALVTAEYPYTAAQARAAYGVEQERRKQLEKDAWERFFSQLRRMTNDELIAYVVGGCRREVAELARGDGMTFDKHLYKTRLKCAKQHVEWRGLKLPSRGEKPVTPRPVEKKPIAQQGMLNLVESERRDTAGYDAHATINRLRVRRQNE